MLQSKYMDPNRTTVSDEDENTISVEPLNVLPPDSSKESTGPKNEPHASMRRSGRKRKPEKQDKEATTENTQDHLEQKTTGQRVWKKTKKSASRKDLGERRSPRFKNTAKSTNYVHLNPSEEEEDESSQQEDSRDSNFQGWEKGG